MSSNLATTANMQLVIAPESEWGKSAEGDYSTLRIKGQSFRFDEGQYRIRRDTRRPQYYGYC